MDIEEVLFNIISIPIDYTSNGKKSIYTLVLESGYIDKHEEITENVIEAFLEKFSSRISDWVAYSEDQRTSEGRFLMTQDNKYSVVEFAVKHNTDRQIESFTKKEVEYPSLASACAAFIKYELEFIRKLWLEKQEKPKKKKR